MDVLFLVVKVIISTEMSTDEIRFNQEFKRSPHEKIAQTSAHVGESAFTNNTYFVIT